MAEHRDGPTGASPEGAQAQDRTPARRPIDSAARARIGRGLRLHYAAVLDLPVPERLRALLDDLADPSRESPR